MSENPYQTPSSDLSTDSSSSIEKFYVVSIKKFTILFFSTVGIYTVYWFYKNWQQYRMRTDEDIWPVPRGIFSIFFAHSLFNNIQEDLVKNSQNFNWNPGLLATGYVVFSIISNVADRLAGKDIGSPWSDMISFLMLPVIYIILVQAQKAINISQNDRDGVSNDKLTFANYFWVLTGLSLWALAIVGQLIYYGILKF